MLGYIMLYHKEMQDGWQSTIPGGDTQIRAQEAGAPLLGFRSSVPPNLRAQGLGGLGLRA